MHIFYLTKEKTLQAVVLYVYTSNEKAHKKLHKTFLNTHPGRERGGK